MNVVRPKTYLIGHTAINHNGLAKYLCDTDQQAFSDAVSDAELGNLSGLEILCSFMAKLCYKALTADKNKNLTRVRAIKDNLEATLAAGHGSVFEHVWLNFVTTNCSRVFTHELVRHRIGTAHSQVSGRYVRSDELDMVLDDPILLQPCKSDIVDATCTVRDHLECLGKTVEQVYGSIMRGIDWTSMDFATKKKMTSALRRILPNGQANEIGWSANIRALRHIIMLRTSRYAEWEIRSVFHDVWDIVSSRYPTLFFDAKVETVDGLYEVTGMKTQPY